MMGRWWRKGGVVRKRIGPSIFSLFGDQEGISNNIAIPFMYKYRFSFPYCIRRHMPTPSIHHVAFLATSQTPE